MFLNEKSNGFIATLNCSILSVCVDLRVDQNSIRKKFLFIYFIIICVCYTFFRIVSCCCCCCRCIYVRSCCNASFNSISIIIKILIITTTVVVVVSCCYCRQMLRCYKRKRQDKSTEDILQKKIEQEVYKIFHQQ